MPSAAPRRVVLDTNVVISAAWGGIPGQVVDAWLAGRYTLLVSPPILAEYQATLERLLPGSLAAETFLHAVYVKAIAVNPTETIHAIRRDPSDNRFLECAVAGGADVIVSGDQHLLRLKQFRQVLIVTPRAFLEARL